MEYRILAGDCIARMQMMDKNSVDDIITDPPYEINMMGHGWDNSGIAYNPHTWKAAHRVLKPNGLLVVFGATRTHHRIAHAIERAGFEIVEIIAWTYSTGFPKNHNIGKVIEKKTGSKSDQWEGWGTALKPAWEPIIIARKKGSKRTVKNISKFIHAVKASKKERNRGLEGMEKRENEHSTWGVDSDKGLIHKGRNPENRTRLQENFHPTVKPVKLMKILVDEYSEKGGTVFDPFVGSGTTGMACVLSDRNFIGCELTEDYLPLIRARIEAVKADKEGWI